ncbi:MAG: hypothetical protein J2P52_05135 [Blastocatellia bacterium]|nr:hypothetical protein [Blastocatellia bacterium]
MRNICRVFATFAALLAGVALVNAQSARTPSAGGRGSDRPSPEASSSKEPRSTGVPGANPVSPDPGVRFISSEMSFGGKLVKGIPYSAETLTESTQILNNGVKLTRQTTGMVYRDDEGRTRREMAASAAGPFATSGDTQRLIFINDPVAGVSSTISQDSGATFTKTLPASSNDEPPELGVSSENSRTESLGKEVIEGFVAEGTRATILIPPGSIGNDKPIEIVHELWYSPELQTILLSKHSDPRWGETVYKLRNIDRGAPDHSLFSLPAPSTLKEKKTRPRQ